MRADGLTVLRRGSPATRPSCVAVGPTLDETLAATSDLDATVAYLATVRPFDADGLRALVGDGGDVVLVEPYLAGTSAAEVAAALADRPHRLLSLGVANVELRRYGSGREHRAAHGLDAAGIRRSFTGFLEQARASACVGWSLGPTLRGATAMPASPNIVLVHGAWADGSSWSAVIERLQADGYNVTAPQFGLNAIADDVARLRHVLRLQSGPTLVAGHSYGGQIITSLGTDAPERHRPRLHRRPSASTRASRSAACSRRDPRRPALANLSIDDKGFAWLPQDDFVGHFAADVDPVQARVMHAVQQPLHTQRPRRRDGRAGVEVAAVLVPRRRERRGDPARRRAAVRPAHGRDHGRGRDQATSRWSPTPTTWSSLIETAAAAVPAAAT